MKKIFYASCLLFASISTFVSCQKDEESDFVLSAIIADTPKQSNNSKVYIENSGSDCRVCWHNNDYININGQKCTLNVANSTYAATISGVNVDATGNGYSAVYPYAEGAISGFGSTTAIVTVPSSQTYVKRTDGNGHSYQEVAAPMVAHCDASNNVLKFHNAAGIIRVNVKNSSSDTKADDIKVHYISITAGESAPLAGTGEVPTNTASPLLSVTDNASSTITLDCCHDETDNHPVIAVGKSETFYLVAAPFTGKTLTIKVMTEVTTDNTKKRFIFSKTTNTSLSLGRNNVGNVSIELTNSNYQEVEFLGAGTKDCPYLITNLTDLGNLRTQVAEGNSLYNSNSIYYKQTEIITLSSWTSAIGTESHPFAGNYDGDGNSITAIPSCGLFAFAGGGNIENLNVTGSVILTSAQDFGGIVCKITSEEIMQACTNSVSISFNPSSNVNLDGKGIGGCVGCAIAKVTMIDCVNDNSTAITNATETNASVGGIIGRNEGSNSRIINCKNNNFVGNTSYSGGSSGAFGGICGRTTSNIYIERCKNNGFMQWKCRNSSDYRSGFGGILGESSSGADVTIKNCENTERLMSTESQSTYFGGIMGYAVNPVGTINIEDCINTGGISLHTNKNKTYAGGIVGMVESDGNITIKKCKNGTLSQKNDSTLFSQISSAGIIAACFSKTTIEECTNYMTISASNQSGGIIGISSSELTLKGCITNHGNVTAVVDNIATKTGGVIGYVSNKCTIDETAIVENFGNVSGGDAIGGIIAYFETTEDCIVRRCINHGVITSGYSGKYACGSGGIIGHINGANSSNGILVKDCGNENTVTAVGTASGVVGHICCSTSISRCTIQNCYCDANVSATAQTGGIVTCAQAIKTAYVIVDNCYYNGIITGYISGSTRRYGSIARITATKPSTFKLSFCYADATSTETPDSSEPTSGTNTTNYNAARTFSVPTGAYANKGVSITEKEWRAGKTLWEQLDSVAMANGYARWNQHINEETGVADQLPRLALK